MLKGLIFSEWNIKHLIKNAKQSLEWRRSKVLELSSEGRSQSEIARILHVSPATVNADIQFLRQEAKENISKYIDERLPFEYQKCMVGLDAILCRMSDIANNTESNSRDILQATSVKMQAYAMKLDLLSNATVIEKAVQFVDRHRPLMDGNKEVRKDDSAGLEQDIR
jgi:FixJ family two-component response regulator